MSRDLAPTATTDSFAQEDVMSFLRSAAWVILIITGMLVIVLNARAEWL
jgi:hypothetical protein